MVFSDVYTLSIKLEFKQLVNCLISMKLYVRLLIFFLIDDYDTKRIQLEPIILFYVTDMNHYLLECIITLEISEYLIIIILF